MNNNTNHGARLCAALSSPVSITLTVVFMFGLVEKTPMAYVMGAVGLCLEVGKMMFASEAGKRSGLASLGFYALAGVMMAISVLASFAALERGFNDAVNQSSQHVAIQKQITQLDKLYESQLTANHITKANQTMGKINALNNQLATLPPESAILEHAGTISLIASLALELVCVVSVSLSAVTVQDATGRDETPTRGNPTHETVTVVHREPEPVRHVTFQAREDKEQEIRDAVVSRVVKPSVRGVREVFTGISNDRISAVLKSLGDAGVLVQKGQGWAYA